jgi:hypothetical protein
LRRIGARIAQGASQALSFSSMIDTSLKKLLPLFPPLSRFFLDTDEA